MSDFVPRRESLLEPFATNLVENVADIGVANLGLTAAQQADLQAKVSAFVSARALVTNKATRTPPKLQARDTAKAVMIAAIRAVSGVVQKHPGTTNEMRSQLGLSVPHEREPAALPGTPGDFKVTLGVDGALSVTWKCTNTRAAGTIYQIWRRAGQAGEFAYVGGSGQKKFVDATIPAGTTGVTYQIQAVRSTGAGAWAQVNVNFGQPAADGGAVTAKVAPATPKIAA